LTAYGIEMPSFEDKIDRVVGLSHGWGLATIEDLAGVASHFYALVLGYFTRLVTSV